ncbi:MAG: extracellular solute-binding protein [Chloroflexi bacterium]|nr:extracellular solute-binding protein [Chloroflexota bacterium]
MRTLGVMLTVVALLMVACAPKAVPAPALPPTLAPTPVATSSVSLPTSQDTAWAKVVSDARKEGRVTMYSFGFTGDVGKEAVTGFEKAYGIKVEIVGGVGAVLLERLKTERAAGKPIADTYDSAPSFLLAGRAAGLTAPTDSLPELTKVVNWRLKPVDPEKVMYPVYLSIGAPYMNTSLVKAGEEPKSYKDLLQPRWKGKILMAPPVSDPTGIYPYVAWKKYGTLDADDYYRQLGRQDLKLVPSVRDVAAGVARGEGAIGFQSTPGIMNGLIGEGAPARPLSMEEGHVLIWGLSIAAIKDAPHPNAARVLINWLLTPEGQTTANKTRGALPIREDLPDFGPAKARLVVKKPLILEVPDLDEMSRLQRDKAVDKIMGLETK